MSASGIKLSKSKYCTGLQCLKALYLTHHHPEFAESPNAVTREKFSKGSEYGTKARSSYPDGILIKTPKRETAIAETKQAMNEKRPAIFEGAFSSHDTFVRVDILALTSEGTWDIIEAKASLIQQQKHLNDMAIQRFVVEGAGVRAGRSILKHGNNFLDVDCTAAVLREMKFVPAQISRMLHSLNCPEAPSIEMGSHCNFPYECLFKNYCSKEKK